jgi:hypothetical protein
MRCLCIFAFHAYLSDSSLVLINFDSLPLLCQTFLSSNVEAHKFFARGGKKKDTLVILVPEHLVNDARTQVFRHCLNINFRQEYKVYDDIFALLHSGVQLDTGGTQRKPMKQIFVTSFNQVRATLLHVFIISLL